MNTPDDPHTTDPEALAPLVAPVITAISPTSGPAGTAVTLTGSGFTGVVAVRFGVIGTLSFTVVSDTQINATVPAGGSGTVSVTVTSGSGTSNGVPYTYTGGPTAPVITAISPTSGPAGTAVTLTGSGFTGVVAVRFGVIGASSFTVVSDTQINATVPAGGSGTVSVTVTSGSGTSNGVPYTYGSAPAAPVITAISPTSGPASGGTTVTITGTGLTTVTAVHFGAAAALSFTVVSSTNITAVAPAGTGTVQLTVTGPGGTSNGLAYTYVAVPVVTAVTPNQGPTSGGNTVALTGSGFTGAITVAFGSTLASSFTVVSSTQITAVVPPRTAGPVPVTVTTAGGTSNATVFYFYVGAPTIAGISPTAGPIAGGNTVTLTGSHFLGASAVTFDMTSAGSFTVLSDTEMTAVVPSHAAGPVQVTVTTPGGTSNSVFYTYLPVPTLTSVSPTQGPTSASSVTLTGTGLAGTTSVTFGATPAAFTVVSDTSVVAEAPAGSAGPVNVSVTTPGGTSNAVVYTRLAPPEI